MCVCGGVCFGSECVCVLYTLGKQVYVYGIFNSICCPQSPRLTVGRLCPRPVRLPCLVAVFTHCCAVVVVCFVLTQFFVSILSKGAKRSRIKSYSMQPSVVQHVLRRSGQIYRQATGISQLRTFTTSKMVLIKVGKLHKSIHIHNQLIA